MMLDSRRYSLRYHNQNRLVLDLQAKNKDAMLHIQYWLPAEIETFKERSGVSEEFSTRYKSS